MGRAYVTFSRLVNALLCLVGAAMVVSALARGAGPLAVGVVVGALFCALGAARLLLSRGARPGSGPARAEPRRRR